MKKKVILVITVVVILLGIVGIIFYKNQNTLKVKETVFTFEMGEKFHLKQNIICLIQIQKKL